MIFDFRCTVCGDEQEKFVRHGETPVHCGILMEKLVTFKGAFVLKGGGFYQTEYGTQEHNLGVTGQAQRAARECKERGLVPATPGKTDPREVEQYQRRQEAGSYN